MEKIFLFVLMLLFFADTVFAESCSLKVSIDSEKTRFQNDEKIFFYNTLNRDDIDYVIEYWIEDSEGRIIKPKINTSNQDKKSFTPKNANSDIIIKARIANSSCADTDLDDNYDEKRIFFENIEGNSTNKKLKISFEIPKKSRNRIQTIIPLLLLFMTTLLSAVLIWKR